MATAAGESGAAQAAEDLTRRLQTQLVRVIHYPRCVELLCRRRVRVA